MLVFQLSAQFKGRVTAKQISDYWVTQAWAKYKACQDNIVKHTGGGDRDINSDSGADSESEEPSGQTIVTAGSLKATCQGRYSRKCLVKFMDSPIYTMIHQRYVVVCHSDASVTHSSWSGLAMTRQSSANVHTTRCHRYPTLKSHRSVSIRE